MNFSYEVHKDFFDLELNGIPPHRQDEEKARHRVKWRLMESMQSKGVSHPYDSIYFTSAGTDGNRYSESLVNILADAVIHGDTGPIQFGTHGGFYGRQHTTADEERLDIGVDDVNEVTLEIYTNIKETWHKG